MRWLAIIAVLVLSTAAEAIDDHPAILLQAHTSPDPAEIQAACESAHPGIASPLLGCAIPRGRVCEIWVTQPSAGQVSDLEIVGHEVWHCLFGDYHD